MGFEDLLRDSEIQISKGPVYDSSFSNLFFYMNKCNNLFFRRSDKKFISVIEDSIFVHILAKISI